MNQRVEGRISLMAKATLVCLLLLIVLLLPNLSQAQRIIIDDFPVVMKDATIVVPSADLTVTQTSDPGGHSCCVTAPPSLIEIFLTEGDLVLREVNNGNVIPWLDFDPAPVDSNLEFITESRATVAGFTNILTVLTGNVTADGIEGRFSIGAGGGLPGGQPINYDFLIESNLTVPFTSVLALHLEASVPFSLLDVLTPEEKPQDLYLLLRDDIKAPEADWWLVTLSGGQIQSFDLETLTFQPGLRPTYQGPTIDIPEPVKFAPFEFGSGLPPNSEVTVFFGIDTIQNGVVDEGLLGGIGYTYYFN
ncbi:MAG: hypothetical protein WDZ52_10015 [Pseudohongiellaceae bacterium]